MRRTLILLMISLPLGSAQASLCEEASRLASQKSGVPQQILDRITRLETGRGTQGAWPWAINRGGHGAWPKSRAEALVLVRQSLELGERNIDIGCFQLNYRWHSVGFSSLEAMFDPAENALYAAHFLSRLYQEFGDWQQAIGAYHSRTPKYAQAYLDRYADLPSEPAQSQSLQNRYPFLQAGRGALGSLVPNVASYGPLLASLSHPLIGGQ